MRVPQNTCNPHYLNASYVLDNLFIIPVFVSNFSNTKQLISKRQSSKHESLIAMILIVVLKIGIISNLNDDIDP